MRVGIVWECPWIVSSYGKLTLWLAHGLIKQGFDVRVYCPFPAVLTYDRVFKYKSPCIHREVCVDHEPVEVTSDVYACSDEDVDVWIIAGTPHGEVESRRITKCSHSKAPVAGYIVTETYLVAGTYMLPYIFHFDAVAFPARAVADAYMSYDEAALFHGDWVLAPHGLPDYYFELDRDHVLDKALNLMPPTSEIREALEARRKGKCIGTFAKNHPRKDYPMLLTAFAYLRRQDPELRLLLAYINFVGAPVWDIQSIKMQLGLTEGVIDLNQFNVQVGVTEFGLLTLYSAMNVYAIATLGEGFGLPLVEAGALRLPIVATRTPVLEEIWEGYELLADARPVITSDGHVLFSTNPVDLAEKIKTALENQEEYGRKARAIAEKYRLEAMVKGITELVDKAVRNKGRKIQHPIQWTARPAPRNQVLDLMVKYYSKLKQ